ncbi:ABC transporter ATP-binding protein [Paraburkholderia phenoliruptrix]|uniref:ABC transporter ATP-binding protein n=1 Tax=Paraburkholderia phenoliruptrix TaxID=252970 RepID=UPI002869D229|nr:ABC transporter ATP-binding protein [Paraburkholderia phenoliruptrix]WMY10937.1 ABC transporter ATP-binding protein [Paraburkholderia phenoliruptrix]
MSVLTVHDLVAQTEHARLVDGVNFSVRAGRTLGLVGESGSGKSVTCLSVLGLPPRGVQVTGGRILFDGDDLRAKTPAELNALRGRDIGMILQDPMTSLNPLLTIGRQITEMFRYREGVTSRKEREARAIELLRRVRIPAPDSRLNSYPHQFSGGMRQRVAIAMNLACNPRLLIADEPTTALDITVRLQILDLLREVQTERGTAIVLVTHDLHLVRRYCDDIAVMYAGRIIEQGPVADVFARPRHPYTRGLLGAVPRVRDLQHRLTVIPGQPPLPGSIAQGCRFAPRCPRVQTECMSAYPAIRAIDMHRSVACWHPEPDQQAAAAPLLATAAS